MNRQKINYGLQGRFAPENRRNWLETIGAVLVVLAFSGMMAMAFAGFMR